MVKRRLNAELPEPPLLPVGGLPLFCVPPTDETVAVAVGVVDGVGPTVGVSVLSVAVGEGVGKGDGVGEGVGEGVAVGVALQRQDTLTLFACGELKVIVALAGQVMFDGIVMFTLACFCGCNCPAAGLMVMPLTPLLTAVQLRDFTEPVLLNVTVQFVHLGREVGETVSVLGTNRCICGAASVTDGRRASDGITIARTHRRAKATITGNRENLEEALRDDIA